MPEEPVAQRTFSNSWKGFIQLTDWMRAIGVSMAVVESTGIYWCAAFTAVERTGIEIVLANPRQVKNVAQHKTDLKDSVWLAVLLRAGFIRPSYVPKGVIKDLRDATRMRARLMRDLARTKNRCHRILDTVLVDVGLSDAFGKTARLILLRALRGEATGLTEEQQKAFEAVSEVQRLIITDLVRNMEALEERVKRYDVAIAVLVERVREEQDDRNIE
ncbi:MAG: IS110 family transposase [Candidatus Thorarchaeota archaeon]